MLRGFSQAHCETQTLFWLPCLLFLKAHLLNAEAGGLRFGEQQTQSRTLRLRSQMQGAVICRPGCGEEKRPTDWLLIAGCEGQGEAPFTHEGHDFGRRA